MLLLMILLLINNISFLLFGIDKRKAVKNKWRFSENTLILVSFFAPLGALIGMHLFKHKTKKFKFTFFIPLFVLIQLTLLFAFKSFLI